MLSIYKIIRDKEDKWVLLGVSFSLVLLSHVLTFAICCIVLLFIIILNIKQIIKNKQYITIFKAIGLGLCLSAFFLFPLIEQRLSQGFWMDFTIPAEGKKRILSSQYSLEYLFNSSLSYTNYTYGILQIVITIIIYIYYRVKVGLKVTYLDLFFAVIVLSSILSCKIFDLSNVSILYVFQFYWRFLLVFYFFVIAFCCDSLILINNKKINAIILIALCLFNIVSYYFYIQRKEPIPNSYVITESDLGEDYYNDIHGIDVYEVGNGEYVPYTNSYNYYAACKGIIFPNEDGYLFDFDRKGSTIIFNTNLDYDEYVYMPLSWYKGYYYQELDESNQIILEKECFPNEYNKRVGMKVEKGNHTYKVYYKGTIIQKISVLLSSLSFFFILYYKVIRKKNILKIHNITDK